MSGKIKVFSGNTSKGLTANICRHLNTQLGKANISRFADGEIKIQIKENVREKDVFIINSLNPPAENILETVFLTDAVHRASAKRITLVIPYIGYARQDKKDRPRVPLTAHIVYNQFLSHPGVARILLLDLHSEQAMGFFKPPIITDHLYASAQIIPYLKSKIEKKEIKPDSLIIASTDAGGTKKARAYSKRLECGMAVFDKNRTKPGEVDGDSIIVIGDIKGKDILFIDDMIDTGGTIATDVEEAKNQGANKIYVVATHALFSNDALKRLDNDMIKEIIITDTISHPASKLKTKNTKMTIVSIVPLLAEAIHRIHEGESLSSLIL